MSWVFFPISPFENNFHPLEPASRVFYGEISLNIPCTDPEVNGLRPATADGLDLQRLKCPVQPQKATALPKLLERCAAAMAKTEDEKAQKLMNAEAGKQANEATKLLRP